MEIKSGQEARVFEVKESTKRKNTIRANVSTYEGKNQDEKARYSSWNSYFVGKAYEKAKTLYDKDQIILTNAKVENFYDKEKERLYVNLTVFDFEKFEKKEDR